MRLTDAINVYKLLCESERLDEAMTSEFTFGFELEGCCTEGERRYNDLPGYHSGREPSGDVKTLFDKLNDTLGFGSGKIESDSSLNTDDRGGWTFEYASPIIPFNPKNIEQVYNFLKGLPSLGVYTNDSCGFHTHISYPDIDKVNAFWILCCIALDKGMYEEMTKLTTESGDDIDFFGHYAQERRLIDIKRYIENKQWDNLKYELDTEKYQNTRIHPQGTIEWRGPRNFMNKGNINDIHRFILKLYRVVQHFAKYTRMDSIPVGNGEIFTKQEMAKRCINGRNLEFNSPVEKKKISKKENMLKAIEAGKKSIFSLPDEMVSEILARHNYRNDVLLKGIFNNKKDMEKVISLPKEKAMKYIEPMVNAIGGGYDYTDKFNDFIFKLMQTHGMDISKKLDKSEIQWIEEKLINVATNSPQTYGSDETYKKLDAIYKPFEWNDLGVHIKKRALKDPSYARRLPKAYNLYSSRMSPENYEAFWDVFMNQKRLPLLTMIDEIPLKYQRKLVRKNPFNIQYIKNPDKAIVDWVLKKEPEAKDYMLGGI